MSEPSLQELMAMIEQHGDPVSISFAPPDLESVPAILRALARLIEDRGERGVMFGGMAGPNGDFIPFIVGLGGEAARAEITTLDPIGKMN